VDSSGSAYITGLTDSTNFPSLNPIQGTYGGGYYDAFVTKLDPSGSALVYSTYLGGNGNEYNPAIVVDSSGSAYITGYTYSTNFPTFNPIQPSNAGSPDAFVTKLDSSGTAIYSTYLGGSNWDGAVAIAVDSSGSAYVTGETYSSKFPTVNPIQASIGGTADAFVTKLNPSGTALVYSTFLGGKHGVEYDIDYGTDGMNKVRSLYSSAVELNQIRYNSSVRRPMPISGRIQNKPGICRPEEKCSVKCFGRLLRFSVNAPCRRSSFIPYAQYLNFAVQSL
jgi:hypothetical protein